MTEKEIEAKVGELTQREEFGRGIIRMDSVAMQKLGIREGDIIELEGSRKTGAIAVRPYPSDAGLKIIRMDGLVRKNCGVGVGDNVKVRKVEVKEAKKVQLAPAQRDIMVRISPSLIKQNIYYRPMMRGDIIVPSPVVRDRNSDRVDNVFRDFMGFDLEDFFRFTPTGETRFVVTSTSPPGVVRITDRTNLEILPTLPKNFTLEEKTVPSVTYEDIGGIHEAIHKVREMIELPLRHPELFEKLGIEPPKGVLLHGPPGTGKTLLARAVANEAGASFYSVAGPEVISMWYGKSEENLRKIFDEAEKNAPSIIFIDEIDSIAPKREEVTGEVERRVVSTLLTQMDGLKKRGRVIVIAATNRVNSIDPALRRPGRFDREIEIGVPTKKGRIEVLEIHTRHMPLDKDVSLRSLGDRTYGFVGADLEALTKEAAMHALRRILPRIKWKEDKLPKEMIEKLIVKKDDFEEALKMVEPSGMREVLIEVPNIRWGDVGGLEEVKDNLQEAVEWPLKIPGKFKKLGITPPKGILMYGPPGCGKTMLAKAVATESNANFISVKGPELLSKWVGESEKRVRELFRRAKQVSPSVIFFDEIDAMVPRRGSNTGEKVSEKIVSQVLTEMSGLEDLKDIVVVAATNRPDMLDPALLRPGRFDRKILVPEPDLKARVKILEIKTKEMPLDKSVKIKKLAEAAEGFSGADLESLCREAGMNALRADKKVDKIKMKHFEDAMKEIKPSLNKDIIKFYRNFDERSRRKMTEEKSSDDLKYVG